MGNPEGLKLIEGGGGAAEARSWVLVQTNARQEVNAACHLRRLRGVEAYLPMREWRSKRSDGAGQTPLFPGYVFVSAPVTDAPWALIRTTIGVHGLPQVAGGLCRVPSVLIARLKSRELFGLVRLDDENPRTSGPRFTKGERLRIASGALEGFDVVFDAHLPNAERVWVLMQFCGDERRIQVEASRLAKGA